MTKYPQDHYDDVPEYTDQVGAHRAAVAKPESNTGLNVLIIAAALALVVGIVAFLLLPQLRNDWFGASAPTDEQTTEAPADPSGTDADAETDAGAGEAETTDEDATGGDETDPTGGETGAGDDLEGGEEPDPTGAANVDYSQGIEVYNATMTPGLAGQATQQLTSAGFNVPITANWQGSAVSSSVVYYADDEATAQAIADELGITAVHVPSMGAIAVVLADDFAG